MSARRSSSREEVKPTQAPGAEALSWVIKPKRCWLCGNAHFGKQKKAKNCPFGDLDFQSNIHVDATSLWGHWSGFWDSESGISKHEWSIGTKPGKQDVLNFTDVGPKLSMGYTLSPRLHIL